MVERLVYTEKVAGSIPAEPTKMKKFIIPIIIFILIFFFIGLFFSKKETSLKIIKENQKQKEVATSSLETNKETSSLFILEFERKVNEEVNKLTEKIKPDENKSINAYREEIAKIQQKFNPQKETQEINPDVLIEIAQDLSKINPPTLLYSVHLELIKVYYKLGLALKEYSTATDPTKKILLYNLIKATLEKIKF
jgi:predicted RND superfamily exporter protein